MKECVAFLLDFLPCDRLKEDAWEGDLNLMVRSYAPSLARRNACFSMGADPWTTDLDSVAQDVSNQACPSFEVASGDQPAYITDWITSLSAQKNIPGSPLAQDGPVLLFQPPSFSPKRTVLTLENVEGKKPGSIRTSPTIRAVSLSAGIPLFSTEKKAVNYRTIWCRKEPVMCKPVSSSKPLRLRWLLGAHTPWSSRLGVFRCGPLLWRNCPRESQMTQAAVLPRPLSRKTYSPFHSLTISSLGLASFCISFHWFPGRMKEQSQNNKQLEWHLVAQGTSRPTVNEKPQSQDISYLNTVNVPPCTAMPPLLFMVMVDYLPTPLPVPTPAPRLLTGSQFLESLFLFKSSLHIIFSKLCLLSL